MNVAVTNCGVEVGSVDASKGREDSKTGEFGLPRPGMGVSGRSQLGVTRRIESGPASLIRDAAGDISTWSGKLGRLAFALRAYGRGEEAMRRLTRLRERGLIDEIPTRLQLAVGAADMVRFWISPAAADYYDSRSIDYGFHQLLRFLDEPSSLVDPIGILSTRDGIIGHLMQVVHANPRYDLDLLQVFDDGLASLEAQLCEMLAGTHVRSGSISAIVEEPDYHDRLLGYVRAYRDWPDAVPPLRANIEASAEWRRLERTFGSLRSAMRYFCRMPTRPRDAIAHVFCTREFPWHLGEA